jgi:hypothetical protein
MTIIMNRISNQPENKLIIFVFPTPATTKSLKILTKYHSLPFPKVLNPSKEIINNVNFQTGINKVMMNWANLLTKIDLLIINFENTPTVFLNIFFEKYKPDVLILLPDNWVKYFLLKKHQRLKYNSKTVLKINPNTFLKEIDLILHKLEYFIHYCQQNGVSAHITRLSQIINPEKQRTTNDLLKGLGIISKSEGFPDDKIFRKIATFLKSEESKSQKLLEKETELKEFIGNDTQYYTPYFKA